METPNWSVYEADLLSDLTTCYPGCQIKRNVKLAGKLSDVMRQVDILIEGEIAGFELRIAVEAKHRRRPIDVPAVEAFIGFCQDIGVAKGLMVSLRGFTAGAENRARNDASDVELEIANYNELQPYQGGLGFPYMGSCGAMVTPPFGWVIDAQQYGFSPAIMYQSGLTAKDALNRHEFMYIKFFKFTTEMPDLESILAHQEREYRSEFPDSNFKILPKQVGLSYPSAIREIGNDFYPHVDFSGFLEFEGYVFMCTLITPLKYTIKNLRKLRSVLSNARPIKVDDKTKSTHTDPPTQASLPA